MELFRKKDSRFYWYDFKVRGKRYRGSTKETNRKRAGSVAALRFSQAIEGTGLLDRKAPTLQELSTRFLGRVESAALASKTRKYYTNGWRLLSSTTIAGMRLDHITKDQVEALRFDSSAANLNCALRTFPMLATAQCRPVADKPSGGTVQLAIKSGFRGAQGFLIAAKQRVGRTPRCEEEKLENYMTCPRWLY